MKTRTEQLFKNQKVKINMIIAYFDMNIKINNVVYMHDFSLVYLLKAFKKSGLIQEILQIVCDT